MLLLAHLLLDGPSELAEGFRPQFFHEHLLLGLFLRGLTFLRQFLLVLDQPSVEMPIAAARRATAFCGLSRERKDSPKVWAPICRNSMSFCLSLPRPTPRIR